MRVCFSVLAVSIASVAALHTDVAPYHVDLVIYGATPAGFAASLSAKSAGLGRVLVIEPTAHVGGMASPGGIGLRDCEHNEVRDNNSTQKTWAMRNAAKYGQTQPAWQPDAWLGEQTFLEMMAEGGVELWLNSPMLEGAPGLRMDGPRITAVGLENGTWIEAAYFIDASYEGEVMVASGCTFAYGREAKDTYNESLAGVTAGSVGQFKVKLSPYVSEINQTLLPWVQDKTDPRTRLEEYDDNVMGYSFRACLTDNQSNMVPFTAPANYDPADFELQRRLVKAEVAAGQSPHMPWGDLTYHGYPSAKSMKYDACCGMSPVGIDATGLAVGYPTATRAQRAEHYARHRYYVQGLMWFWASDPAVPEDLRRKIQKRGLCKDEWADNGHFPPQLYVREAARVVGDKVFTQNSRIRASDADGCLGDSIAIGSWGYDIHEMERVAVVDADGDTLVYNEGLTAPGTGGDFFFEIPYSVVLPKRSEVVNLAVPNTPSVSHVAWAGIREEPTLWQLGQAAGAASAIASAAGGIPLQDIDTAKLQAELVAQHTFVHWPPRATCSDPPTAACDVRDEVAISVSGAGLDAVDGVYTKTSELYDSLPVFSKDATHQLYRYGGVWRLAHEGELLYYSSPSSVGAMGPPKSGFGWHVEDGGTSPTPADFVCGTACDARVVGSITVSGAGLSDVNGVYAVTSQLFDKLPVFQKDSTHQLYRRGGVWRLAHLGEALYYIAPDSAMGLGPPRNGGWKVEEAGVTPSPVSIACSESLAYV